jgi:hypothetical protein
MSGASKACQQLLLTQRFLGEREKSVSAQMGRYQGNEETKTLLCAHTGASARTLFKGPPHHLCGARLIISFAFDLDTLEDAHGICYPFFVWEAQGVQWGVWRAPAVWGVALAKCLPAACHHVIQAIGGRDDHVGKLPCKAFVLSRSSHAPHGGCSP